MAGFETLLTEKILGDRYLLQEVIGTGGMGAVFRAYDQQLGRLVAIKVMGLASGSDEVQERMRRWFRREAKLASQLNHRNVVLVHDFASDASLGLDYLVMELLSGVDLAKHLAEHGPPAPHAALALFRQAVRGVAAGHRIGLVHRDIKAANLFLAREDGEDTRLVVLDFGIALPGIAHDTLTLLAEGVRGPLTPGYAAPEQLTGGTVTAACDVFSLAATAFELFTGERMAPPGEAAGTEPSIRRARALLARRADAFPAGVAAVLDRALSPAPGDRFQDAGELAAALDAATAPPARSTDAPVLAAAAVVAPAPVPVPVAPGGADPPHATARPSVGSPARRRMRWPAAGGVVAVALIASGAVWQLLPDAPSLDDPSAGVASSLRSTPPAAAETPPSTPPGATVLADSSAADASAADSTRAAPLPVAEPPAVAASSAVKAAPTAATTRPVPVSPPVDSASLFYSRGTRFWGEQRLAEAEQSYRDVLRLQPNNEGALVMLGLALHRQTRYADAEHVFREAVRLQPSGGNYASLGLAQFKQGHYGDAQENLRAALLQEPSNADYHWWMGETLRSQQRYREAETSYREAVRLKPNATTHRGLGSVLLSQGRHADAEPSYREAVRLQPRDASLRNVWGLVLGTLRRWDESVAQLEEAVRLEPGNATYRTDLATARTSLERSRPRMSCTHVPGEPCTVTIPAP